MFNFLLKTIFALSIITVFAGLARANTYAVTVTADSGPGSLRQAIINANLHPPETGYRNTIRFHIPGGGVKSITLQSPLPAILYPVEIDGSLQDSYGTAPAIEINGMNAGANASGLRVVSGDLILKGVAINRFRRYGIYVASPGRLASMTNCRIGTDVSGTIDLGNRGDGIYLTGGFSNDDSSSFIGPDFAEPTSQNFARNRNVISGNGGNGIRVTNSHRVWIGGNYIGTDANGLQDLGNDENGILFTSGSGQVGAEKMGDFDGPEEFFMLRNLISGNDQNGVKISDSANDVVVNGNYIGTTASGNAALGNSQNGVLITNHDAAIRVGSFLLVFGSGPDGNLISGNKENGVKITGMKVNVANNLIGTNAAGLQAVGNGQHGVPRETLR